MREGRFTAHRGLVSTASHTKCKSQAGKPGNWKDAVRCLTGLRLRRTWKVGTVYPGNRFSLPGSAVRLRSPGGDDVCCAALLDGGAGPPPGRRPGAAHPPARPRPGRALLRVALPRMQAFHNNPAVPSLRGPAGHRGDAGRLQSWPALSLVHGVLQVALYPYGNAHENRTAGGEWEFSCQHGEQECRGNILEVSSKRCFYLWRDIFCFLSCVGKPQANIIGHCTV